MREGTQGQLTKPDLPKFLSTRIITEKAETGGEYPWMIKFIEKAIYRAIISWSAEKMNPQAILDQLNSTSQATTPNGKKVRLLVSYEESVGSFTFSFQNIDNGVLIKPIELVPLTKILDLYRVIHANKSI